MASFQTEQLEALLRKGTPSSAPGYRTVLERLYSELNTRESRSLPESRDFFVTAAGALKKSRGTGSSALRLRCLYLCWRYFFLHSDADSALQVAEAYRNLAARIESPAALRLSYNLLGMVHGDIGNIGEALQFYLEALEIAKQLNDLPAQCSVLNNVGTALNYAGLYREAIPCFNTVISIAQPQWSNRLDKYALSNLAQAYYYLEDLPAALDAIDRCTSNTPAPSSAESYCQQTIREFMYVQIALELDRLDLALRHLESCRRGAQAVATNRCKTMASIATARCEVVGGRVDKGLLALEQILLESRALDAGYRDALIAIVKAYDDAERPAAALKHLESLVHYERERRTARTQALLSMVMNGVTMESDFFVRGQINALEHRRAVLRARVAEHDAASSKLEMLERLAGTADLKEDASGQHGYRVGKLAALLAVRIGWSDQRALSLELASRLHDIGKIAIPDRILGSSQSLKDAERHIMRMHTSIGAELLAKSEVPQLQMAEEIARYHHEHWDGSGYPDNLSGRQIPIHARIVALADVFDALTHRRPFSVAWGTERALDQLMSERGKQFDPVLTDAFLALIRELQSNHLDTDTFLSKSGTSSPLLQVRNKIQCLLEQAQEQGPVQLH